MLENRRNRILVISIILLLVLRFVPAIVFCYLAFPRSILQAGPVGSFLVFLFLIHHERNRIVTFHIDQVSLAIILLLFPIQFLIPILERAESSAIQLDVLLLLISTVATVIFLVFLMLHIKEYSFQSITVSSWTFLLLGPIAGVLLALVWAYPMSFQIVPTAEMSGRNLLLSVDTFRHTLSLLGSAAVFEEPFFRAFLWGFLVLCGFRPGQILILQVLLFSLAHFYYVPNSLTSFFFVVPVGALCLGYLAMKTRSVSSSIIAHGVADRLGYSLGYILAELRK